MRMRSDLLINVKLNVLSLFSVSSEYLFPFLFQHYLLTDIKITIEFSQWFCKGRFLDFVNVLLLYIRLIKDMTLHLNKLTSPLLRDA